MTSALTDARASAAAEAAVGLLPAAHAARGGHARPTSRSNSSARPSRARFTGSAQGEIVVVVGSGPRRGAGAEPARRARPHARRSGPALEAAAATLGPGRGRPGRRGRPGGRHAAASSTRAGCWFRSPTRAPGAARSGRARAVDRPQIGEARDAVPPVAGGVRRRATTPDDAPAAGARRAAALRAPPSPAGFAPLTPGPRGAPVVRGGLELLHDVEMEVTAELGRTRMSVRDLLVAGAGRGHRARPARRRTDRPAGQRPADRARGGRRDRRELRHPDHRDRAVMIEVALRHRSSRWPSSCC